MKKKISKLFDALIKASDSPQKKALGFGLGVFLGVIPGTGPIASLVAASFLRLNRASALLGSLLTNTWLSIVIFASAVKVGSYVMGISYRQSFQDWKIFAQQFHFSKLFQVSLLKMALPVLLGYFFVSLCVGFAAYLIALMVIIVLGKKKHKFLKGI